MSDLTPHEQDTADPVVGELRGRLERAQIKAAEGSRRTSDLRRELDEILEHGDDMT